MKGDIGMVNIQIDKLGEFILSKCKEDSFNGFTTISKLDINNNTYELKDDEQKYIFFQVLFEKNNPPHGGNEPYRHRRAREW